MRLSDVLVIPGSKHVFKQNFQAVGKPLDTEIRHAEEVISLIADLQLAGSVKFIGHVSLQLHP